MASSLASPSPNVQRLRLAATALAAALALLCLAWELVIAPTGRGTLALKALPLLLALPGLWAHRLYTYRWLSLAVWLYALEGLVRAPGDSGRAALLAWSEVVLAVALFTACACYVRARFAAAHAQAAHADEDAAP